MSEEKRNKLICDLYDIEAIKFGDFTFKSGIKSKFYIDLRVSMSYPKVARRISQYIWESIPQDLRDQADLICGVPYGALHYANTISQRHNIPMIMKRKEAKDYGTKKLIEGNHLPGQKVLIIEDTITTGGSVKELCQILSDAGLNVLGVGAFFSHLRYDPNEFGVPISYSINMSTILQTLSSANRFHNINSYADRAQISTNPNIARLLNIMETKKTNLALSVDLPTTMQILRIIEEVAPYICMVKTHIDTIQFSNQTAVQSFTNRLKELSTSHNFLILEDRKFADIAHIAEKQFKTAPYCINSWADFVTCHSIAGPHTIRALGPENVLLLGQMSSYKNLASIIEYTNSTASMGETENVAGFIAQRRLSNDPTILTFTPGISIAPGDDAKGQLYRTPKQAISSGSDVLIVGREITLAHDPKHNAEVLRDQGWTSYLKRLKDLENIDLLQENSRDSLGPY